VGRPVIARTAARYRYDPHEGVVYAQLGRIEEARYWLERLLVCQPGLTIAKYKAYASFFQPEVFAVFVEGLRKAGLPEA